MQPTSMTNVTSDNQPSNFGLSTMTHFQHLRFNITPRIYCW